MAPTFAGIVSPKREIAGSVGEPAGFAPLEREIAVFVG